MNWLAHLFSRNRRYDDLAVSIQEHLDDRTDELMEEGMSREEAARTARGEFGNVTQIAECSREAWQWPALESIWADVKFALRQLRKSPGFTLSAPVVIINEEAARKYWPNEDPIGKRIGVNYTGPGRVGNSAPRIREIVGIVQGMKHGAPELPVAPAVYMPYLQDETNHDLASMSLFVRSEGATLDLERSIRTKIHALRPDQSVNEILSMQDLISHSLASRRYSLSLLGIFAALALLLSAVGIYGVVSYTTLERRREFGIRLALGATRSNVMAVVLRHGLLLTLAGISAGIGAALLITRILTQLLFQISPLDATSFILSFVLLVVISIVACILPALRAARLDPVHALRSD